MSDPFVGEIKMFAGNFAPRGWAFCDGQLLAVSQNDALFSLFGTIYGGDGRTTFGLPDLRGRIPLHQGQGPGLSSRKIGNKSGQEDVTLTTNQLPSHTHTMKASNSSGERATPSGSVLSRSNVVNIYRSSPAAATIVDMSAQAVSNTGGSQHHSNLMPFLCIHYIVALFGIYPSRN